MKRGIGHGLIPAITRAGLSKRVSFLGALGPAEKRALLQRSDAFVLASADESFGIAVAEAMAVGCPVVVSPDVALAGVVRSSGAGLVVERDPSAIASAVETILGGPSLAAAMGEAGRKAVESQFSWPAVALEMEAMYTTIVRARRSSTGATIMRSVSTPSDAGSSGPGFRCPTCGGVLARGASDPEWHCEACGWGSASVAGIPIFLSDPEMAEHDEHQHHQSEPHKLAQAAHFDDVEEQEFEIVRPHQTPRLYRFLLAEKFRRSVSPIRPHLVGASALSVCGGSGMDAEFIVGTGAIVTTSDLSLGAATRAMARSRRYGLGIQSIVADVEHLPFADESIDLVAVHDGLHHLDDPYVGLSEMARVARRWVVITEPAQAWLTRLAVRLGLALDTEPAGNRVARLSPPQVAGFLVARGFVVVRAERYAMYYPHRPGMVFGLLSRPAVFPAVRVGMRFANALFGRFGNKMVLVAVRDPSMSGRVGPDPARLLQAPSGVGRG